MKTLLIGITVLASLISFDRWSLDGWVGVAGGLTLHEDTVYAPGYSDAGFRAVRLGMTVAEVEKLIGRAERTWTLEDRGGEKSEFGARWSHSAHDTNYRCRLLLFRDGRVTEKHSEFYVD